MNYYLQEHMELDCPYCGGLFYADHQSMDVGVGVPYVFQTEAFHCEECGAYQVHPHHKGEGLTSEEQKHNTHRGDHHTCLRPLELRHKVEREEWEIDL